MHCIKLKYFFKNSDFKISHHGFSLIELLVSISIITMVSSVVLVRNNSFNGAVLLRDQAYEVAFALKQAQLMAVSGTNEAGAKSNQFGIYFDTTNSGDYITFRDDGTLPGRYEDTTDVKVGLIGHLDKRFAIRAITYLDGSPVGDKVSVTFKRPNFDAIVKKSTNGAALAKTIYIDIAQVGKGSDDKTFGAVRRVQVTPAGQISVVTYPN